MNGWNSEKPRNHALVFVLPPGDDTGLLRAWAEKRSAEIAPAPSSEAILGGDVGALPDLESGELLIIPELERWFRRHQSGLALVRELIERLERSGNAAASWA